MDTGLHAHIVKRLLDARGRWPAIARDSGVSLRTIEKIARREIADPGISHIEKLLAYFERPPQDTAPADPLEANTAQHDDAPIDDGSAATSPSPISSTWDAVRRTLPEKTA